MDDYEAEFALVSQSASQNKIVTHTIEKADALDAIKRQYGIRDEEHPKPEKAPER